MAWVLSAATSKGFKATANKLPPMLRPVPPVNRYGYSPVALEWDLWVNSEEPWNLDKANVDHGSAGQLVQQVRGEAGAGARAGLRWGGVWLGATVAGMYWPVGRVARLPSTAGCWFTMLQLPLCY